MRLRIFTDGGYSIGKGVGVWAYAIVEGNKSIHEDKGEVKNSTSNRVELIAFLHALQTALVFEEDIEIISDSQYVVKGYSCWIHKWEKSGWKNKKRDIDLWKQVFALKSKKVKAKWVKGHSGNKWNEYVDEMTKI
jgi:ribonuclease HI